MKIEYTRRDSSEKDHLQTLVKAQTWLQRQIALERRQCSMPFISVVLSGLSFKTWWNSRWLFLPTIIGLTEPWFLSKTPKLQTMRAETDFVDYRHLNSKGKKLLLLVLLAFESIFLRQLTYQPWYQLITSYWHRWDSHFLRSDSLLSEMWNSVSMTGSKQNWTLFFAVHPKLAKNRQNCIASGGDYIGDKPENRSFELNAFFGKHYRPHMHTPGI